MGTCIAAWHPVITVTMLVLERCMHILLFSVVSTLVHHCCIRMCDIDNTHHCLEAILYVPSVHVLWTIYLADRIEPYCPRWRLMEIKAEVRK